MVVALVLLGGAAGAVVWGQLLASALAPWVSMGLSAGAVVATALSLTERHRPQTAPRLARTDKKRR